jgi:hypothetical protein
VPTEPQRTKLPPLITKGSDRGQWGGEDDYSLYRDSGVNEEGQPEVKRGMRLLVSHEPNHDSYAYRGQSNMYHGRALSDLSLTPGGVQKLFGHHREEGTSTVHLFEGTKESRIHAGTMLAVAAQDTMQNWGRQLGASDDRSKHSEAIVQHLQRNLGTQFSEREYANHMTFDEESHSSNARAAIKNSAIRAGREIVPEGQVLQGRQTIRNMLRPPIQGPKKPDHEQLTLF